MSSCSNKDFIQFSGSLYWQKKYMDALIWSSFYKTSNFVNNPVKCSLIKHKYMQNLAVFRTWICYDHFTAVKGTLVIWKATIATFLLEKSCCQDNVDLENCPPKPSDWYLDRNHLASGKNSSHSCFPLPQLS